MVSMKRIVISNVVVIITGHGLFSVRCMLKSA